METHEGARRLNVAINNNWVDCPCSVCLICDVIHGTEWPSWDQGSLNSINTTLFQLLLRFISNLSIVSVSGVLTLSVTNPIWVAKTRLCLQYDKYSTTKSAQPSATHYKGTLDCLVKIGTQEGFRGLYKVRVLCNIYRCRICIEDILYWHFLSVTNITPKVDNGFWWNFKDSSAVICKEQLIKSWRLSGSLSNTKNVRV